MKLYLNKTFPASCTMTTVGSDLGKTQKIFADKMDRVLLYGSYARGDYTDDSDIDIMIILNCPKEEVSSYRRKTSQMASRIGLEYDVLVSIILRDKETFDLRKEELPFYQNVVKDGIKLYGSEI